MPHNTFKLVNYFGNNGENVIVPFLNGNILFIYILAVLSVFLISFALKIPALRHKILFTLFFTGSTFFLGLIAPRLILFNEDDLICGRVYGFFDTIHPYLIVLLILYGCHYSQNYSIDFSFCNIDSGGIFFWSVDILRSFFTGVFIYIVYIALYFWLAAPAFDMAYRLLPDFAIMFYYAKCILVWPLFGAYTGVILDSLITGYKPPRVFKLLFSFVQIVISVLIFLSMGMVFHVNEGSK